MHRTSSQHLRRAPAIAAMIFMAACSFGPIEKRLLSDKPKTREKAMRRLQGMSPEDREKVIPPMIAALSNEDGRIANRAAEAIVVIGEPAVDEVIAVLNSEDPFVKIIGTNLLGEIAARPDDAIPPLVERVNDPHPLVREEAVHALGRFGARAAAAAPALQKALLDPAPEVREAAQTALREAGIEPVKPTPKVALQPSGRKKR